MNVVDRFRFLQDSRQKVSAVPELSNSGITQPLEDASTWLAPIRWQNRLPYREDYD